MEKKTRKTRKSQGKERSAKEGNSDGSRKKPKVMGKDRGGEKPRRSRGRRRGGRPRSQNGPRLQNGKRWLALWWNKTEALGEKPRKTKRVKKRKQGRRGRRERKRRGWRPRQWYTQWESGGIYAKRNRVRGRVSSSPNNTKVVRTWYDRKKNRRVNRVKTAGSRGYANTKRGSSLAAQEVRRSAGKECREKREKARGKPRKTPPRRHRSRRGMGRGRIQAIPYLEKSGRKITTVSDMTKNPHNGCRRKKKRRI